MTDRPASSIQAFNQISRSVRNLTVISKDLYPEFHISQLQLSRLTRHRGYQQLMQEMTQFNQQLHKWKQNKHEIANLVLTYHLYENLFSRMKYISIFCNKEEQSISYINQTIQWFIKQKPRVRNYVPQTQGQMKPIQIDASEKQVLEDMVQTNIIKRQMQPYQIMARTEHAGFYPPKIALKEYRRKQIQMNIQKPRFSAGNVTQTTAFTTKKLSFRGSMATRSTFKDTKLSFKGATVSDKKSIPQLQQLQLAKNEDQQPLNPQINEANQQNQMNDQQRQKKVNQQEIIQDSIVPKNYEEDQPDEEALEEEEQQQIKPKKQKKIYSRDPDFILIAEEKIKDAEQSTLRRIINHKEQKIQIKLEELNIKRNMMNWGQTKSKTKKQQMSKLERAMRINKFKDMEHKIPQKIKESKPNQNVPPAINMLYRSKSSHMGSLETDLDKIRIKNVMATYGRYIQNHVPPPAAPAIEDDQDREAVQRYRAMSLTSVSDKMKKRNFFGDIIRDQNAESYNNLLLEEIVQLKNSLTKKQISVSTGSLLKSSSIPQPSDIKGITMYSSGKSLLSNPFFPKHLYTAKKKKKK